jgi:DNA primase
MDLIEALETAQIDFHAGRDDDEIYLCCPFCTDERFRLGVNVRTGYAQCFNDGCGFKAKHEYAFQKLQEALDTGEIEAKQERIKRKKRKMETLELPEGFAELLNPNVAGTYWLHKALTYVRKRGVTKDQIKEKHIGYTCTGTFAYRVIFPVYLSGVLVGIVGRDFTGKFDPVYKNSIGAKCIYNLPEKKHSTAVLSEAVFTSLAIERVSKKLGIDSLGLLGHSIKPDQVDLLHHYKRIIIWLDPDVAGMEGLVGKNSNSKGIYHQLKEAGKTVKVILPKGMLDGDSYDTRDPDEMESNEISKRLERAEAMSDGLCLKIKNWLSAGEE